MGGAGLVHCTGNRLNICIVLWIFYIVISTRGSYRNAVRGNRLRYPRMLNANPRNTAGNTFPERQTHRSECNSLICDGIASSSER